MFRTSVPFFFSLSVLMHDGQCGGISSIVTSAIRSFACDADPTGFSRGVVLIVLTGDVSCFVGGVHAGRSSVRRFGLLTLIDSSLFSFLVLVPLDLID